MLKFPGVIHWLPEVELVLRRLGYFLVTSNLLLITLSWRVLIESECGLLYS